MSNVFDRAVSALRECADAYEQCPIKRIGLIGTMVSAQTLRDEADYIETQSQKLKAAFEED